MASQHTINGITVTLEDTGNKHAPALVLSHSLLLARGAWDPILAGLKSDYRVITYDLRGHGDTDAPEGAYSMALLADDALALLDTLEIERAHFVGLSIGGMIGMTLAGKHPERVDRLVLAACGPKTPPEGVASWQERIDAVKSGGIESQIDPFLERWFTNTADADTLGDTAAMMRLTPAQGFIGCCHAIMEHDALGLLGQITAPTLVITGSKDPGATPQVGDLLASKIKGAEHETITNAAHQIGLQRPDAFVSALRHHMAKADKR